MGKTFRTARPNPDYNIPADRAVKESTARRFVKAVKKLAHHRERRRANQLIHRQLQEAARGVCKTEHHKVHAVRPDGTPLCGGGHKAKSAAAWQTDIGPVNCAACLGIKERRAK